MTAPSATRRYLSVWLRRLATDRIVRERSVRCSAAPDDAARKHPLAVVAPVKSALRLMALDDTAARLGLTLGMALADARAMYPRLIVADADPLADQHLLEAIAAWCDRYTPLVGLQPPDGVILDISGCTHLFGGEAALARDLVGRLAVQGLQARVAVADTVGCAWGVARYGNSFIVPPGATREALVPLPLAALRLAPDPVTLLGQVGLKCIADILDRPRASLAARFGSELLRRLDQALGVDEESITPCQPLPLYVAEQRFAEPIVLERDVLGTIQRLGARLELTLEQHGEGARLIEVILFRVDGKLLRVSAATSRAIRDAALVRRLFAERLAAIGESHDAGFDPGFGFDLIRLSVVVAEPLTPRQTDFNGSADGEDISELIDRLGARVGFRCVLRVKPHDTHIPEFAALEVPANRVAPRQDGDATWRAAAGRDGSQDSLAPLRPIKLFARPEPIEAVAEVPDGPPVRFRWRHVLHEVAAAEGPERLAMEWWRDEKGAALTRDYFRLESREGARYWVFREGLYGRETAKPNWFLHGLFG